MATLMKIDLLETWGRYSPGKYEFFRPIARDLIRKGKARERFDKPKAKAKAK
jgi:hypothetical protein